MAVLSMIFYGVLWAAINEHKNWKSYLSWDGCESEPGSSEDNERPFVANSSATIVTYEEVVLKKPEKKLQYIVNGETIPCPFERYYYLKLGMALPILRIDRDVVERHYQRKVADKTIDPRNRNRIEAANLFLNDRLNYLEYLN